MAKRSSTGRARPVLILCAAALVLALMIVGLFQFGKGKRGPQPDQTAEVTTPVPDTTWPGEPPSLPGTPVRDWQDFDWKRIGTVAYHERYQLADWAYQEFRFKQQDIQAQALDLMNESGAPVDTAHLQQHMDTVRAAIGDLREASQEDWPERRDALLRAWAQFDGAAETFMPTRGLTGG